MPNSESSLLSIAMLRACDEARLWIGATSPNPPVGATALDENGDILAIAGHKRAGEDHAEAALLKICLEQGLMPRIHTICVTLEPCNHQGRTPPCTESLIEAEIRRVVIGARDPNKNIKGGGCERLREAGIEVIEGVETEACRRLIHAFAFHAQNGKPFVTVKRALNEQGSMIPDAGHKTFTSQSSLVLAHKLRKKADAIVTGSGTIIADKPLFNVRHVPDHAGKRRLLAIHDRSGRIPRDYINAASQRGLDIVVYQDLDDCFSDLERRGALDVLVEAGPTLSEAILASPHWTMKVDIRKTKGADSVETSFNPKSNIPFNINGVDVEALAPL